MKASAGSASFEPWSTTDEPCVDQQADEWHAANPVVQEEKPIGPVIET